MVVSVRHLANNLNGPIRRPKSYISKNGIVHSRTVNHSTHVWHNSVALLSGEFPRMYGSTETIIDVFVRR